MPQLLLVLMNLVLQLSTLPHAASAGAVNIASSAACPAVSVQQPLLPSVTVAEES